MKRDNKGFTLVEMIIVMSLTIVVITAIFSFFIISKKISSQTEIKSDLQREAAKVQQSIIDVGTQSEQLLYVKGAGGTEINTVGDYIHDPTISDGTLSIKEFAFKLPDGKFINNITLPNNITLANNEYLKFVYKLEDSKLKCIVYKVASSVETEVKSMVVCDFVGDPTDYSISIKPVNWELMNSLSSPWNDSTSIGGKGDNIPFSAIKLTIKFKISRGFYTGDKAQKQSINAIVKFRNDNVSEES